MKPCFVFTLCLFLAISSVSSQRCLDSKRHKASATQEDFLHGQCSNWNSMSCCTKNTTFNFHNIGAFGGFNYDHCNPLSKSCRQYFEKEMCLYECDPYLEQWIVQDNSKKHRNERFYHIPLCKRDCDNWFNACKDEFTCLDNWNKGFFWKNGTNYCRAGDKCETFEAKFETAENFCSKIWDDSFTVSSDEATCIRFDLKKGEGNPNKVTATRAMRLQDEQTYNSSARLSTFLLKLLSSFAFLLGFVLIQ